MQTQKETATKAQGASSANGIPPGIRAFFERNSYFDATEFTICMVDQAFKRIHSSKPENLDEWDKKFIENAHLILLMYHQEYLKKSDGLTNKSESHE